MIKLLKRAVQQGAKPKGLCCVMNKKLHIWFELSVFSEEAVSNKVLQ